MQAVLPLFSRNLLSGTDFLYYMLKSKGCQYNYRYFFHKNTKLSQKMFFYGCKSMSHIINLRFSTRRFPLILLKNGPEY